MLNQPGEGLAPGPATALTVLVSPTPEHCSKV